MTRCANVLLVVFVVSLAVLGGLIQFEFPPQQMGTGVGPARTASTSPRFGPPAAEAAPTISWAPAALTTEVARGYTRTYSASFISSEHVTNVQLRVVPKLQPFVTVTPASFTTIGKGQTVSVTVTVSASSTAPFGTVNGTLQLRVGNTLAKPLPLSILVTVVPLPPDPGTAAGSATLAGIDSDGDGVRDDVQRYIALTYPDSEKTRLVLTAYARAAQSFLLSGTSSQQADAAAAAAKRSLDCLVFLFGDSAPDIYTAAKFIMLNTAARLKTYLEQGQLVKVSTLGTAVPDNAKLSCDFDPDTIPN